MSGLRTIDVTGMDDPGVLDTPSVQEFLQEIHKRATREQLDALLAALGRKAQRFGEILAPDALTTMDEPTARALLRSIFVTRRRVGAVLGADPVSVFADRVAELLYGSGPLEARFDAFCAAVALDEAHAPDLAAELLHFSAPDVHPLWSRWIWDPRTRTGALPLVMGDDVDLEADGPGAVYARVAQASRFLDGTAEVASFRTSAGGSLATDVFLVGVYSVYMNTVLGLKMSQEFNAIVPALPELGRRLLGVHRMEV